MDVERERGKRVGRDKVTKKMVAVLVLKKERKGLPLDERDLIAPATILLFKLQVVHGPATLIFRKIAEERLVINIRRRFFDDDLRLLRVECEDDVLVLLPEL
jgi:hypothetical protein